MHLSNLQQKSPLSNSISPSSIMNHNNGSYSRDDQEVGVAHEVKSLKNQPQFFQTTMGQYWLGPNKLSD